MGPARQPHRAGADRVPVQCRPIPAWFGRGRFLSGGYRIPHALVPAAGPRQSGGPFYGRHPRLECGRIADRRTAATASWARTFGLALASDSRRDPGITRRDRDVFLLAGLAEGRPLARARRARLDHRRARSRTAREGTFAAAHEHLTSHV